MTEFNEGDRPRNGDLVRVQARAMEGRLLDFDGTIGTVVEDDGETRSFRVPFCTVEVLERADDPSQDLTGLVREYKAGVPAVCYGRDYWVYFGTGSGAGYGVAKDREVIGCPVIGSVPGTPAAANDPGEFVRDIRKANRWAGESDAGYQSRMVRDGVMHVAQDSKPNMSGSDQVHLGRVEDCEHEWCQPKREPRVFQSDGPEPPEDVDTLEVIHPVNGWTHLRRDAGYWRWFNADDCASGAQPWPAISIGAEFREVLS